MTKETTAADVVSQAATEAVNVVSRAVDVAKEVVQTAANTADERTTATLAAALREVFGENRDARRFVDITRIPLICQSIVGIHSELKDLKQMVKETDGKHISREEFWPVKTIVYSGVGITLTAVIGALIALVIRTS